MKKDTQRHKKLTATTATTMMKTSNGYREDTWKDPEMNTINHPRRKQIVDKQSDL